MVDSFGQPVSGAQLLAKSASLAETLGESGPNGIVEASAGLRCDVVVAVKDGYARGTAAWGDFRPGTTTDVVLGEELPIGGVVIHWKTGRPVSGVLVYARPTSQGYVGNPYDTLLAGMQSPVVSTAVTDSEGRFTLGGLLGGEVYDLVAASPGLYSTHPIRGTEAGSTGHVIKVEILYGLQIELVAPGGLEAVANEWVGQFPGSRVLSLKGMKGSGAARLKDSVANLTGTAWVDVPVNPFFILMRSDSNEDRAGPFILEVRLPGYEHMDVPVYATPLDDSFKATPVHLTSTSTGFGDLLVNIKGFSGDLDRADSGLTAGSLHFHSSDGTEFKIGVSYGVLQREVPLAGIPNGNYNVHFQGYLNFAFVPSLDGEGKSGIECEISGPGSSIELDFSNLSAIELEMLNREGQPKTDNSGFHPQRVHRDPSGKTSLLNYGTIGSSWLTHGQKPFLLVAPGQYEVSSPGRFFSLVPPIGVDSNGLLQHPVRVDLSAGEVASLIWQMQ